MNCIVIDDEELAREGLERYIQQVDFLILTGSFDNALGATEVIKSQPIDLMFLDIQMPYLTGIDFVKNLANPPLVIFHTAFPNFALESYQLDVIDYLVKPITFDRFHKAVSKAYEYFQLKNGRPSIANSATGQKTYFFIKCGNSYEKVVYDEIMYVEAMQNYSVIQTLSGKLTTLTSLKKMEDLLPSHLFVRAHKSYIISLDRVESIEGNQVKIGQRLITLAKGVRETVFRRLLPGEE